MGNTGGPCQKWNMRREWTDKRSDKRELYYSDVDKRIHLFGAEEGWIQIGHFAGQKALGEIRMADTDGNGFFDRWEVWWGDAAVPARVTQVRDEKARRIPFDSKAITKFHNDEMVPGAMAANAKLLTAMGKVRPFETPPGLSAAMADGSPNERRYVQDVVREMHYQDLRQHFGAKANEIIRKAKKDDGKRPPKNGLSTVRNTHYAWRMIRALQKLDVAYGEGDFDSACAALNELSKIEAAVKK